MFRARVTVRFGPFLQLRHELDMAKSKLETPSVGLGFIADDQDPKLLHSAYFPRYNIVFGKISGSRLKSHFERVFFVCSFFVGVFVMVFSMCLYWCLGVF